MIIRKSTVTIRASGHRNRPCEIGNSRSATGLPMVEMIESFELPGPDRQDGRFQPASRRPILVTQTGSYAPEAEFCLSCCAASIFGRFRAG